MRLTLPSAISIFLGCSHPRPPVPPGPPIPAEPEVAVGSMDDECKGLETALATYGECPNLEDPDREWIRSTIEFAEQTFAAGKKAGADAPALHAMALACHRAATSVHYATVRCLAGPKPRED
jgi:hypothetical protein